MQIKLTVFGKISIGEGMNNEIDLNKYQIRTDLIVELISDNKEKINTKMRNYNDITVEEVNIDENTSKLFNKKIGKYVTISFNDATDSNNIKEIGKVFAKELELMMKDLHIIKNSSCLIVGLGNIKSTPDSLGPKVVENVIVTRHLFTLNENVSSNFMNTSIFIPGVMGSTGLETSDVILGVVEKTKPDFLIVIDALRASSISRINKTIQLTDTGVSPGSGIGNNRKEISKDTINCPVIGIGVPTVVDSVVLVSDTINYLFKKFNYNLNNIDNLADKFKPSINYLKNNDQELSEENKRNLLGIIGNLTEEEIKSLISEVLTPIGYNMMVTPKEVDFVIEKLATIISRGINTSLHDINY